MGVEIKLPFELQYAADNDTWASCLLDDQFNFLARMTQVFTARASMASFPDDMEIILCNQKVFLRLSVVEVRMPGDILQYNVKLHGTRRNGDQVKMRVIVNDRHNSFIPGIQFVE